MYAVPELAARGVLRAGRAEARPPACASSFPAAVSGIVAALIVGFSRAIGETMIVAIAAGGVGGALFKLNPLHARPDHDRRDDRPGHRLRPGRAAGSPTPASSSWAAAVRDDAGPEPGQRAFRAPHQERVLMADATPPGTSATTAAVERALRGQTTPDRRVPLRGSPVRVPAIALGVLVWLLSTYSSGRFRSGRPRPSELHTSPLSSDPAKAGIAQGLFGSLLLMVIVIALTHPDRRRGGHLPRGVRRRHRA